ncbi:MAG: hypothetical protein IJW18_09690 [Lachnospiraceae bacterium]|nr:hypothetical protein [Lachnospiraceae bacterium]
MKFLKKLNPFRYINGVKGAISLFLVVLMTPFLTIAMMLVEVGRYNSAVAIMDEALAVSSVSTLANYDQFLQDRWGLYALSQEIDVEKVFEASLEINKNVMGNTYTVESLKPSGILALSEEAIMDSQILDYCKLNAPTTLMSMLDLDYFISQLESLKNIGDFASILDSGAGTVEAVKGIADSAESLKKIADELDKLKTEYNDNYNKFSSAVNALIDKLGEERPDPSSVPPVNTTGKTEDQIKALNKERDKKVKELEKAQKEYDKAVEDLQKKADEAKSNYASTVDSIITKLGEFRTSMSELDSAQNDLIENVNGLATKATEMANDLDGEKEKLTKCEDKIKELDTNGTDKNSQEYKDAVKARDEQQSKVQSIAVQQGVLEGATEYGNTVTSDLNEATKGFNDDVIKTVIGALKGIYKATTELNVYSLNGSSDKISSSIYHNTAISGYLTSSEIQDFLDDQAKELAGDTLSAFIEGVKSFYESMFKVKGLIDPDLAANINTKYYNDTIGGLPGTKDQEGGLIAVFNHACDAFESMIDFGDNVKDLKFIKALESLVNTIKSIIDFFTSLLDFFLDIFRNIWDLFTSTRLYYSIYSAFMLNCRTDDGFKNMTGNKVPDEALAEIDNTGLGPIDGFLAIISAFNARKNDTGNEYAFCGAELEYMLFGSYSEVANQIYAFVAVYLVRLVLDLPAIFANTEVQAIAGATTIAYPVVMALFIVLEPLAETLMLVNGEDVPFYSSTVYFTPSGIPELVTDFFSILELSKEEKEELEKEWKDTLDVDEETYKTKKAEAEAKKKAKESGDKKETGSSKLVSGYLDKLTSFNYREYCFMIMLLTVHEDQMKSRLMNVMQMEGTQYYKNKYEEKEEDMDFSLRKAYTQLGVQAKVKVEPMLPSLLSSSQLTTYRYQYRGY